MATSILTDKRARAAKPETKRYDISDAAQPGLMLQVSPTGGKAWIYRFEFDGKRPRLTIGHYPATTLREAREIAATMAAVRRQGLDPRKQTTATTGKASDFKSGQGPTLAELWTLYENRKFPKLKPNSRNVERTAYNHMSEKLKGLRVNNVTRKDLRDFVAKKLKNGTTRKAIKQALQVAGRICNFAEDEAIDVENPFHSFRFKAAKSKRKRVLTNGELRIAWGAKLPGNISTLIKFVLLTGNRKSETSLAKWSDIDFDKCTWTLPAQNVKTGNAHEVPFDGWLKEILLDHRKTYGEYWKSQNKGQTFELARASFVKSRKPPPLSDYVFPHMATMHHRCQQNDKSYNGCSVALNKFLRGQGLETKPERFTIHDMRRTVSTRMRKLRPDGERLDFNVVRATLNHREAIGVTEEHYSDTDGFDPAEWWVEHRQALDLWSQELRSIVDPTPADAGGRTGRLRLVS